MKKLLIVTGGSSGIGLATAQFFSESGWDVCNISRHQSAAATTNVSLDLANATWPSAEISSVTSLAQSADQICLVHAAASISKDSITTVEQQQLHSQLQISIGAAIGLTQQLLPHFKKGSSIIYVGSTLSEKAIKNSASYVITKHAVAGLMRVTCQDLENTGIHTACVCPGFTDTPMLRKHVGNDEKILQSLTRFVCAHRLLDPKEIAELIMTCAQSPALNGALLHANLGQIER